MLKVLASEHGYQRADAGYFSHALADEAVAQGCDFRDRGEAQHRDVAGLRRHRRRGLGGRQGHARRASRSGRLRPGRLARRHLHHRASGPGRGRGDLGRPRSRRRRTVDPDQLALALDGTATHAYAVSFIVTNVPTHNHGAKGETVLDVEAWFRRRTVIEDRIREAKLGAGMRHLPSGHAGVNTVWMWAALLAGNLSVLLQALTGIDEHGRAHGRRLRHELLCIPARLIRHGRALTLRLPPGEHLLPAVLTRIRELPAAAETASHPRPPRTSENANPAPPATPSCPNPATPRIPREVTSETHVHALLADPGLTT
ncbi:MAG: transposase [Actinomycetota bacterium]|nr:transposase [Actinomycetota bacterium]